MDGLKFEKNSPQYYEFIRKLRNNKKVNNNFVERVYITKKQQQKYMQKNKDKYYVCLYNGQPAGYIGVIDNDIRIAVHPDHQRKGVGTFLIKELTKRYKKSYAKIKIENIASQRLFSKAGFSLNYYLYEQRPTIKTKKLVIYGSSYPEVIKIVDAVNQKTPIYKIVGFIDDIYGQKDKPNLGYPILGGREVLPDLSKEKNICFFNNVNYDLKTKKEIVLSIQKYQFSIESLVHPLVDIKYCEIGMGSLISCGCLIGARTKIGNFLTTRLGSLISHECNIGNFVFIGPGARVCGRTEIGDDCYIGASATILPNVKIGAGSVIGAGSLVNSNIPSKVVAYGVPAKVIKKNIANSYKGNGM